MPWKQCRAKTKAGKRCRVSISLSKDGYCLVHDPKRQEKAHAMQVLGGHRKRKTPDRILPEPKSMADVVKWAAWTVHQVAKGQLDPKRAREITTALRQLTVGIKETDYQRELNEIKKQLKEAKKRGAIK